MDFDLNDEQRLLDETVRRFVQDRYKFEHRKAYLAEPLGFSPVVWKSYAELGLLGLPLPEAHGGFGGGGVETMIVMEALGRGLTLEPYLETVVLCAGLIDLAGSAAQKAALFPEIAAGRLMLALAHGEQGGRHALAHVATEARRDGSGYVLNGVKGVVLHGASAHRLIVSARSAGAVSDAGGISLFLVARDAQGLAIRGYPTIDGRQAAEITLDHVRVDGDALLGPAEAALPVIEHGIDRAIAALCAEAVGAIDALNRTTLDYLKTRRQFGVTIGSFQVLQHRMVDMTIEHEQARSMAILAALSVDGADPAARRGAVSAAKARIGQAGKFVGEQAIQLHGGIGMTDAYVASHYFRRLVAIEQSFGDTDHHLERFAAATLA